VENYILLRKKLTCIIDDIRIDVLRDGRGSRRIGRVKVTHLAIFY
jgi:hypothetical protein